MALEAYDQSYDAGIHPDPRSPSRKWYGSWGSQASGSFNDGLGSPSEIPLLGPESDGQMLAKVALHYRALLEGEILSVPSVFRTIYQPVSVALPSLAWPVKLV